MKTFTVKLKKGQSPGDMAAEWMTEEDWQRHRDFVEQCKKDGTYGQEEVLTLHIMDHPLFDNDDKCVLDTSSVKIIKLGQ